MMMEGIQPFIDYFRNNPEHGWTALAVVCAVYFLLTRRPRIIRDAESRLKQLRDEQGKWFR